MLTRKETCYGANQLPEVQRWTLRLIFLDGERIKYCILANKSGAHRVQKKMIMCSPPCQKKLYVQLQLNPPGEGSAVLRKMFTPASSSS